MSATAEQIKKLRELTGAGVLDAKLTLDAHNGDFDKALEALKAKGLVLAAKKAERVAREGLVEAYIHGGGRVGAIVEVNCETDFVARTPDFKELAHEIALQIVAASPQYLTPADVPPEVLAENDGREEEFYKEKCLLKQPYVRDPGTTIHDLIQSKIAVLRENIVVRRFARFELGE
jgi:elongation factor Ts